MATINVTITDVTKGPFQVLALFSLTPPAGVTVVPTAAGSGLGAPRIAKELTIQAAGNSGTVYWGDKSLTPMTAETGINMPAFTSYQKHNIPLVGEYINADANGAVLAIAADGGFQ